MITLLPQQSKVIDALAGLTDGSPDTPQGQFSFMKLIALRGKHGKGKFAKVDDVDYEYLKQFSWSCQLSFGLYYARRFWAERINRKHKTHTVLMHREILGQIDKGMHVDHKDGDGLNCQRNNIRIASPSQNAANRSTKKKYLGVFKFKDGPNPYRATCGKDGIYYIKSFKTEKEAALAYNVMALGLHGEFAKLNIID